MAGPPLGRSGSANKDTKANLLAADDAKRMQMLEGKIAEQKKELENREITIRAIQRNFEQLSSMCQADKEQVASLQRKLAEAESKVMSPDERERAAKYPKLKDAFDSLNNMYLETEDKMSKLQKQLADVQSVSGKADAEKKSLLAQVQQGNKALEESRRKLADVERAASGWESKRVVMEEQLKKLQEDLKSKDKLRADLEKSETTLRAELSRMQAQMLTAEQEGKKEVQELKKKLAEAEQARLSSEKARLSSAKADIQLQDAKNAGAAYQKQLQEMHALLEKATSKAGVLSQKAEASELAKNKAEEELAREREARCEWEKKCAASQADADSGKKRLAILEEEVLLCFTSFCALLVQK